MPPAAERETLSTTLLPDAVVMWLSSPHPSRQGRGLRLLRIVVGRSSSSELPLRFPDLFGFRLACQMPVDVSLYEDVRR